jgi:cytochrome P450
VRTFVRNPLGVIPQAAYEEDFVPVARNRAWVTSPAMLRVILMDQRDKFRKATQIRLLGPLLGRGILTSEGAQWKWQRQAAAPMFTPDALASFVPAFVRAAEERLAKWREAGDAVQEMEVEMTRATFDVIVSTLLPTPGDTLSAAFAAPLGELRRTGGWDLLYAQLNVPKWVPRPGKAAGARAARAMREAVSEVVRSVRMEGQGFASLAHRLVAASDPETGRAMDDEQLVDNLLTFYLAGHETTAKALTWTLYLLARSPEWTAALQDEVARVANGNRIEALHLDALVLTQQVIEEAMRLFPPVPMMSRQCVADATVEGREIRAGMSVLMPIYAIHRHARRWEDPDAFRPERFAPGNEKSMARLQYLPFGAGPRLCIGRVFATMEAKAMLATFLQRVRFSVDAGREPAPVARVTLVPEGGMPLRVTEAMRPT